MEPPINSLLTAGNNLRKPYIFGLDVVKWLAFGLMVIDHISEYILNDEYRFIAMLGRMAFPLFALSFTYHIALGQNNSSLHKQWGRLVLFGLLSVPAISFLTGWSMDWWWPLPLNILFTFALFSYMMYSYRRKEHGIQAVFILLCAFAIILMGDYGFPGLCFMLASYHYNKHGIIVSSKKGIFAFIALMAAAYFLKIVDPLGVYAISAVALYVGIMILTRNKYLEKKNSSSTLFYWLYVLHLYVTAFLYWVYFKT